MTRPSDLPKEYLKDIGERIRRQREHLKLTQEQMAERLNVSGNYYGKVERGIHSLSYELLVKLPELMHVSLDYILTGKVNADTDSTIVDIINEAPKDKRIYMEDLLVAASKLYKNESSEKND